MSDSFKTFPKPILVSNSTDFDPSRKDRFGHKFKYLEQHISFKDEILEAPLESVLEYEQINIELHSLPDEKPRSSTPKPHIRKEKMNKKGCSCSIQ